MANISDNNGLKNLIAQYGTDGAKASLKKSEHKGSVKDPAAADAHDVKDPKKDPTKGLADKNVFLKLYIQQLKNQDPTAPQDTNDMVAQMSQFSSLEKLSGISDQLKNMTTALTSNQAIGASSLVGKSLLMPGNKLSVSDSQHSIELKTDIPKDSSSAELKIFDANNKLVRTQKLTENDVSWDRKDDKGKELPPGEYHFAASSVNEKGQVAAMPIQLPARIQGVTINGKDGTMLNVENHGKIKLTNKLEILG
ncbi:Basal-body rod modification protein FlgD [Marinomonas spartinae]|uniref:Basal-body rod modification protein FlgD n=1 Tax=Marinomonas spartinae TaxID=1792290 RepID=A0A1A8T912_9GAMM|nr:flagellar hook capping FlgD N-terminal domain-containing protein [Marinomonas spartinae]SBS28065.1 Basal-body rod modification protein FlgD [Marinomonas spartinae]SBS28614.1 Basal-body rod modification protein FlgD [Marinomonas spartinae]